MNTITPLPENPGIMTTTVGSYPVPDWLSALPSEQAVTDATRVIFDTQRQAGIDLPTDGELYRFDINHPDTNGMIEYFVAPMGGCDTSIGRKDAEAFRSMHSMGFRAKPAAVVREALHGGGLNLIEDCQRAARVAGGPFKFTVTSPYMLARTLLDQHYHDFTALTLALADVMAEQVSGCPCSCLQVDEANIPGNPSDGPLAAKAINKVLDAFEGPTAVHFCFGNYGGQTIQAGAWQPLLEFLNSLHADHLVLELAHRPKDDLQALKDLNQTVGIGLGVVNIKVNAVETAEDIARSIEEAEKVIGAGRVQYIHPDCGFWMLKRSVAYRKIAAFAMGRDLYLGK